MKQIVVSVGASSHRKVVANIVVRSGDRIKRFLDDNPEISDCFIGYPVLGYVKDYDRYSDVRFVIAIGNARIRERLAKAVEGVT